MGVRAKRPGAGILFTFMRSEVLRKLYESG
jgi:hypothetical protein